MRIFRMPIWLHQLYPNYIWKIPTQERVVYLSFDDGPDAEVTPFVLDLLGKYNAKATFFCVGENIQRNPGLVKTLLNQGHQIGNHTHNHIKGWATDNDFYFQNIEVCQQQIGPISEFPLFRPPYGRMTSPQGDRILEMGYQCIMWDILSYDYNKQLNLKRALRQIVNKSREGSIVVFHDSQKSKKQLEILLPQYLQQMSDRGYRFELIPTQKNPIASN